VDIKRAYHFASSHTRASLAVMSADPFVPLVDLLFALSVETSYFRAMSSTMASSVPSARVSRFLLLQKY